MILLVTVTPGQPTDPLVNVDLTALGSATSTGSIIISATTNVDGQNWGCADSKNGPLVGTWLTHDIPQLQARDFAVRHQSRWAALGISEGAMCAVRLALTSPSQFAAAISLSGNNAPDARPSPPPRTTAQPTTWGHWQPREPPPRSASWPAARTKSRRPWRQHRPRAPAARRTQLEGLEPDDPDRGQLATHPLGDNMRWPLNRAPGFRLRARIESW